MNTITIETPTVFEVAQVLRDIGLHLLHPDNGKQIPGMIRTTALGLAQELKLQNETKTFGFKAMIHPACPTDEDTEYQIEAFLVFHGMIDEIHQACHDGPWVIVVIDEINIEYYARIAAHLGEYFEIDINLFHLASSCVENQPISKKTRDQMIFNLRASYQNLAADDEKEEDLIGEPDDAFLGEDFEDEEGDEGDEGEEEDDD